MDSVVVNATAVIYTAWDGQFNLSHGPCTDNPTETPTENPTETETPTETPTMTPPPDETPTVGPTETPGPEKYVATPTPTEPMLGERLNHPNHCGHGSGWGLLLYFFFSSP